MELTIEDIEADIQVFQARISAAREKLAALPEGYLPYQEHKKREKARRILEGELKHVQNLIHIAEESLVNV